MTKEDGQLGVLRVKGEIGLTGTLGKVPAVADRREEDHRFLHSTDSLILKEPPAQLRQCRADEAGRRTH